MNYELKITTTNNKSGKFNYQVIDENGNIISERKSNREYVACTIDSGIYWGRLDLIGKGDYKRLLELTIYKMNMNEKQFLDMYPRHTSNAVYQDVITKAKNDYQNLTTIAYKK